MKTETETETGWQAEQLKPLLEFPQLGIGVAISSDSAHFILPKEGTDIHFNDKTERLECILSERVLMEALCLATKA